MSSKDIFTRRTTVRRAEAHAAEVERKRRERTATPSWREQQVHRFTSSGTPYEDKDTSERLAFALVSERPDREARIFADVLGTAMRNGTVVYRLWQTVEDAPARGTDDRLSHRAQSSARRTLALGEDRGPHRPKMPFRPSFAKPGRFVGALHHGHLVVERGFEMATLDATDFRRVRPADFPAVLPSRMAPPTDSTGMPLVVGSSTGKASWALLSERGALAIWAGRDLWTFLALEPFSAPLDVLRERVAPPIR